MFLFKTDEDEVSDVVAFAVEEFYSELGEDDERGKDTKERTKECQLVPIWHEEEEVAGVFATPENRATLCLPLIATCIELNLGYQSRS